MTRHCGYCLKNISGNEIKICGGCKRRCYCSRDCQIADWGNKGQTHKLWCSKEGGDDGANDNNIIGEEDLEWEIKDAGNGKGLGLFAKKLIPKNSKIMIDRGYKNEKEIPIELIQSLMPANGTPFNKFNFNSFGVDDDGGGDRLGIRISRINHSCYNNSNTKYISDLNVIILISIKEILPNEEITIQYNYYNDPSNFKNQKLKLRDFILNSKWGIPICNNECICKNGVILDKIKKASELDESIFKGPLLSQRDVLTKLKLIDQLIKIGKELEFGEYTLSRTYYDGLQISVTNKNTLSTHYRNYSKLYLDACEIVFSKHSSKYKQALEYYNSPSKHRNYLLIR